VNKQEIKKQIKSYTAIGELAEERLAMLKLQLAEAEKSKLEPGAFGIADMATFPRIVLADGKYVTATGHISDREADRPTIVFGNILKLTEEWGKDLEECEVAGIRLSIRSDCIFVGEYRLIPENQGIFWKKIAQLYFTLKRKQG
jgi:hypothetical protein